MVPFKKSSLPKRTFQSQTKSTTKEQPLAKTESLVQKAVLSKKHVSCKTEDTAMKRRISKEEDLFEKEGLSRKRQVSEDDGHIKKKKAKHTIGNSVFKGLVIAVSGNFNANGYHNRSQANFAQWINGHGGRYESDVVNGTTHLICTVEDYKNKSSHVVKAKALGRKQCKIVGWEWIDDCLMTPQKLRPTGEYEQAAIKKKRRLLEKGQADIAVQYSKQIDSTKSLADRIKDLFHHYCDEIGFTYSVVLTRITTDDDGTVRTEKLYITLFESNQRPQLYMVGVRYKRNQQKEIPEYEHCKEMEFEQAFKIFRRLFEKHAGYDWYQRLDGIKVPKEAWVYKPPLQGQPRGKMPLEWVDPNSPQLKDAANSESDSGDTTEDSESHGSENSEGDSAESAAEPDDGSSGSESPGED